jgi:hypothetical protein
VPCDVAKVKPALTIAFFARTILDARSALEGGFSGQRFRWRDGRYWRGAFNDALVMLHIFKAARDSTRFEDTSLAPYKAAAG